jgi:hypothetical protein
MGVCHRLDHVHSRAHVCVNHGWQVAGEAQYTFDIPTAAGGLAGAIANTLQASGVITAIDVSTATGVANNICGVGGGGARGDVLVKSQGWMYHVSPHD